jgi:hypothetical protein
MEREKWEIHIAEGVNIVANGLIYEKCLMVNGLLLRD